MSIPPESPWRGCAAAYPQPLDDKDKLAVQFLQESIYKFNCRDKLPKEDRLTDIIYRNSKDDADIRRHVFRWDRAHYNDVFREGFQARRQLNTPDSIFLNLEHYVHEGGRPLGNSMQPANYAFVSTTLSSAWFPSVPLQSNQTQTVAEAWRYEVYAPGGIWVSETLGEHYKFPAQDEVCFVSAIAPQYIRSAQRFRLITTRGSQFTKRERADSVLILNEDFNPQSHPERLINIQRPVTYFIDKNKKTAPLSLNYVVPPAPPNQRRRSSSASAKDWYANRTGILESYIDAAFRSSKQNEAYLFMKNEYVVLNYSPAGSSAKDKVVKGPVLISEGFPSLKGTAFAEYGIDSAFGSHDPNQSLIFSGNLCARINFTNDRVIAGPMIITRMFPFFKNTVFENGLDAAFESSNRYEAYLFKGDQYALINYGAGSAGSAPRLIATRSIARGFGSLKNTIFERGIDAAFASHRNNEAYLFNGDSYAVIKFSPTAASVNDSIIGGVKKILPNWPSLQPILPRQNRGVDLPPT